MGGYYKVNKLRSILESKDQTKKKFLKKLHTLDDGIEDFISELEDEILSVEDNPMFIKKANQLLADMSKEYSEFISALRSIVNAVDRKSQVLASFDKTESKVRDIMSGGGNDPAAEADVEEIVVDEPETDKKSSPVKEALEK